MPMKELQRILSFVRRAVDDYSMIAPGDKIAVGVSGGKDSLLLLVALAKLREFYPVPFTVEAITLDMGAADGRQGMDFSPIADLCRELDVPYTIIPSEIQHIIFDLRKEKNPCSMCAKMRRGALHGAMQERGITKIALGHHYDDAIETFFMSLIFEGRLSCFQPVTFLDRTGITQIRPLLYCGETSSATPPSGWSCPWWKTPVLLTATPSDRKSKNWSMSSRAAIPD